MMHATARFDLAIQKLYKAFHNNTLNPECCKSCAVGNILDNTDSWKHLTEGHGSNKLTYVGKVHQSLGRTFAGYSPLELLQIEAAFLKGCGYSLPLSRRSETTVDRTSKEVMFNGMCQAVALLCKLDQIQNVMDYSKLFEFENNQPVNEFLALP
ncbi:MAG: Na(+)-translocating NADH-quinone reductase subunit F [Bacteroidota bacterium]|nr:Na(+)-translocating NADH-quinone reductase subunit F [Bacteroidota bacterium]